MAYNEIDRRGTEDFPFAFYHLDKNHLRYTMAAHWHSELELVRILKGEFHITLNNKLYIAKKGDIIFVNSETVHQGTPFSCEYECIVFHADYLYQNQFDSHSFIKNVLEGECTINEFFPASDGEINKSLNNIFNELYMDTPTKKFKVISLFYNFFALIYDNNLYAYKIGNNIKSSDKNIVILKKILSYLSENYDKPITLESISSVVMRSPRYIGCFFKNMTSKTPIEYLNEYRIEKASHLLLSTDISVTNIAYSCGFSDLSYFIKTFKKKMGVSPGKYRNS